jgi:hypothetical protein
MQTVAEEREEMNKRQTSGCVVMSVMSVVACAGNASAGESVLVTDWFELGTVVLGAGDSIEALVEMAKEPNGVIGFQVRFDYDEAVPDASWASDVQVEVTVVDGPSFMVGGLSNLPAADKDWSFQGPPSNEPGTYGDSDDDIQRPWTDAPLMGPDFNVRFTNDWLGDPNANTYSNIEIRFFLVPGPGPLGALGLAALMGCRRRRRVS